MLQVRVSTPAFDSGVNFTDPIILQNANSIQLTKTVNSTDEGISFTLPATDPKLPYVTYERWWECWDTDSGKRLNYGPFTMIDDDEEGNLTCKGQGRSAVLADFYKSIQTFYYPIDVFEDDLRYENVAPEPRSSTQVNVHTDSPYYGLSKRSKDFAIDEQTGYIAMGRDTPDRGTIKTSQFWSGVGRADWLTVDLGTEYTISKARLLLPWWGGPTRNNDRAYDWELLHSTDNSAFTKGYGTPVPNYHVMNPATMGSTVYFGASGYEYDQVRGSDTAIPARYWKINITNTHAWEGSVFEGTPSDEWEWECNQSNILYGKSKPSPTISGGVIDKNEITPNNDCHASVVEVALMRKIIDADNITAVSYKQIQDTNRQITYVHHPAESEMLAAGAGRKFEPGGFFRRVELSGTGMTVKDEYNDVLYTGNSTTLKTPAYCRLLLITGDASARVMTADCWQSVLDAFSYGGSYSYTTQLNDTATLHFRGISVKWYATVPEGVTPATVQIDLREKADDGSWSLWQAIDTVTLEADIAGKKVWEITPSSGTLKDKTIYELRLTNLTDGGYCSIDAFAGYWSGSFNEINQDDARITMYVPEEAELLFNARYSFGSMYEYKGGTFTKEGTVFTGDRCIVYGHKGPGWGQMKVGLTDKLGHVVPIPGGDADGGLTVDCNSQWHLSQVIIFDSADHWQNPGLPWDTYHIGIYKPYEDTGPIGVDGIGLHETTGVSVKFLNTNYVEIAKQTADALQLEWDVTEKGLGFWPRIGTDTDQIYVDGQGCTISVRRSRDVSQIATMLISNGADVDGLPLWTMTEDKKNRAQFKRTIQRLWDQRSVGDYFTLIGASRVELMRRRLPKETITITSIKPLQNDYGDSFLVKKGAYENRVRCLKVTRNQSDTEGQTYGMECIPWPEIE